MKNSIRLRRFSHKSILSAIIVLAVASVLPAGAQIKKSFQIVSPTTKAYGKFYPQWEVAWWQWAISIPSDSHPLTDTADCSVGQSGSVWFLGGSFVSGSAERNCTVPADKALFFPILNTECSTVEPDPFHGDNEAELRACAQSFIDPVAGLFLEIDGVPVGNLSQYRVLSPMFSFAAPDPNVLFVQGPVSGQSVGDGYYILLAPLHKGQHTLHFGGTFTQYDFTLDITYHLTVTENY